MFVLLSLLSISGEISIKELAPFKPKKICSDDPVIIGNFILYLFSFPHYSLCILFPWISICQKFVSNQPITPCLEPNIMVLYMKLARKLFGNESEFMDL